MIKSVLKTHLLLTILFLRIPFQIISQTNSPLEKEKLRFATSLLKYSIEKKDTLQLIEAYYLLGKLENSKMNFQKSTDYFLKCLKFREKQKNYDKIARLYLRLSENENVQNHYSECNFYTQKAIEFFQKNPSDLSDRECNTVMASIHERSWENGINGNNIKVNFDSALYYYKKVENYNVLKNDVTGLGSIRLAMGKIYHQLNDKRAIPYLEYSVLVHRKTYYGRTPYLQSMMALGEAYLKRGYAKKTLKLLQEAEKYLKEGFSANDEFMANFEKLYSSYYESIGDWKMAFKHYSVYLHYVKKTYISDRNGAVSNLHISYETEKKEKQIIEQKREIDLQEKILTLQKQFLWLIISLLVLTIIASLVFFKLFRKNQLLSNRNVILLQEQNHRVKNNLQVISSLLSLQSNFLEEGKAKQAVDESQLRIEAITIFHRQLYDNQDVLDKINMENFIIDLTDIILQTYGLSDIEVSYDIQFKEMKNDKTVFVGLLLNELLTNACKYALQNRPNPTLEISFSIKMSEITLVIKDNGLNKISFLENSLVLNVKNQSFGIKLINMMVTQLHGKIEYCYENGSKFTLKFNA